MQALEQLTSIITVEGKTYQVDLKKKSRKQVMELSPAFCTEKLKVLLRICSRLIPVLTTSASGKNIAKDQRTQPDHSCDLFDVYCC
jgi:predicted house-cleaning noncanonical NTP pyrophosphatase (MazG superfamily)